MRLLLLCAFAAVVCAATPAPDAANGKKLYQKQCAVCHGATGEPSKTLAKHMGVEMRHLGSKEVQSKKDAELRKDISQGFGKMKPVKVTAEETTDIIAFLRALKSEPKKEAAGKK